MASLNWEKNNARSLASRNGTISIYAERKAARKASKGGWRKKKRRR